VSKTVVLSGAFDDLRSAHVRLPQEAGRLGPVHVLLWSDKQVNAQTSRPLKFQQEERLYLLESLRYVQRVAVPAVLFDPDTLPHAGPPPPNILLVTCDSEDSLQRRSFAKARGLDYRVIRAAQLAGFPADDAPEPPHREPALQPERKRPRVLVSGCFDWFHSGHVRFFEEASALGSCT
jgi:glycerol-3-phosphate cytidylyltransferase-like family protein